MSLTMHILIALSCVLVGVIQVESAPAKVPEGVEESQKNPMKEVEGYAKYFSGFDVTNENDDDDESTADTEQDEQNADLEELKKYFEEELEDMIGPPVEAAIEKIIEASGNGAAKVLEQFADKLGEALKKELLPF